MKTEYTTSDMAHLISIVGVGPGNPELLTVKADRRIREADCVLYDALIGPDIMALVPPETEKIYVGKLYQDGQDQTERQLEIHRKILDLIRRYDRVVRLKSGDPMIFARGCEEIRFCVEHGLNYEVVPGLTAGLAAASLFGIPLTERGVNSMVALYTGHRKEGGFTDLSAITEVLKTGSPVVVYMGLNTFGELSAELIERGISPDCPVHILCKVSHPGQEAYGTVLKHAGSFMAKVNPPMPALIIVGDHTRCLNDGR